MPGQKRQTKRDLLIWFKIHWFCFLFQMTKLTIQPIRYKKWKESGLTCWPKSLDAVFLPLGINLSFDITAFIIRSSWLSFSSCSQLEELEAVNWLEDFFFETCYSASSLKDSFKFSIFSYHAKVAVRKGKTHLLKSGHCALFFLRCSYWAIIRNEWLTCILTLQTINSTGISLEQPLKYKMAKV